MVPFGKSWTLQRAEAVAALLANHHIKGTVFLFGRTARVGDGNDLDLIFQPDDPGIARSFLTGVSAILGDGEDVMAGITEDRQYFAGPKIRWETFASLFGFCPKPERNPELYFACNGFTLAQLKELLKGDGPEGDLTRFWRLRIDKERELDIFVLPPSWQWSRRLREYLTTRDPLFLDNIASDAVEFNPARGEFSFSRRKRWLVFPAYRIWKGFWDWQSKARWYSRSAATKRFCTWINRWRGLWEGKKQLVTEVAE